MTGQGEPDVPDVEARAARLLDAVGEELARLSAAMHQLERRRLVLVEAATMLRVGGYTEDEVRAQLKKVGLNTLGAER